MLNKVVLVLTLMILINFPIPLNAQEIQNEDLFEDEIESSDQSDLVELFENLIDNPIDLNSASIQQLQFLPGLSNNQITAILEFRQKHGPFESVEELIKIPEIDPQTLNRIKPFLTTKPGPKRDNFSFRLRSRLASRLDIPRGFNDGTYVASPQKIYHRIKLQKGHSITAGLLFEKDSGETKWDDLRQFYLDLHPFNFIHVIFGNYIIEVGQGLILWGPYGFSKSSETIYSITKHGRGVLGYSSVDENASFWGAAASMQFKRFKLFAFSSRHHLDATLEDSSTVRGLYTSGLHRNANEINKKDVLQENIWGGGLFLNLYPGVRLGGVFYLSKFNKAIKNPDLIRQRFTFRGRSNWVGGFQWQWQTTHLETFGEIAWSRSRGRALIQGLLFSYDPVQLALLYRDFQKNFQNLHGFAFSDQNGNLQNEQGYYLGFKSKLFNSGTIISAYYDIFKHPWRTFFVPLPTRGQDFLMQIQQNFQNSTKLTLRFRFKSGNQVDDFKDSFKKIIKRLVNWQRRQIRLQLDYRLSSKISLRGRLEWLQYKKIDPQTAQMLHKERGLLLYQDLRFQFHRNIKIFTRIIFFDTASFNSRLFVFENDLNGLLTNKALFGQGTRWYFLVKYQILKYMLLSFKYEETNRDDLKFIGSGPDQLSGNLDRRVRFQLDVRY